ncbi:MAG: hypothetical protein AABX93_03575 [Nanoarchaeota archaeon]
MDEKIIKKLEEMLSASNGILSICSVKECGRILLCPEGERQELARGDIPELYDKLILHYNELGKKNNGTSGLSHGLCKSDFEKYMSELEKH